MGSFSSNVFVRLVRALRQHCPRHSLLGGARGEAAAAGHRVERDGRDCAVVEHVGSKPRIPHARICLRCYEVFGRLSLCGRPLIISARRGQTVLGPRQLPPAMLAPTQPAPMRAHILAPKERPERAEIEAARIQYVPSQTSSPSPPMSDCIVSQLPFPGRRGGKALSGPRTRVRRLAPATEGRR